MSVMSVIALVSGRLRSNSPHHELLGKNYPLPYDKYGATVALNYFMITAYGIKDVACYFDWFLLLVFRDGTELVDIGIGEIPATNITTCVLWHTVPKWEQHQLNYASKTRSQNMKSTAAAKDDKQKRLLNLFRVNFPLSKSVIRFWNFVLSVKGGDVTVDCGREKKRSGSVQSWRMQVMITWNQNMQSSAERSATMRGRQLYRTLARNHSSLPLGTSRCIHEYQMSLVCLFSRFDVRGTIHAYTFSTKQLLMTPLISLVKPVPVIVSKIPEEVTNASIAFSLHIK